MFTDLYTQRIHKLLSIPSLVLESFIGSSVVDSISSEPIVVTFGVLCVFESLSKYDA